MLLLHFIFICLTSLSSSVFPLHLNLPPPYLQLHLFPLFIFMFLPSLSTFVSPSSSILAAFMSCFICSWFLWIFFSDNLPSFLPFILPSFHPSFLLSLLSLLHSFHPLHLYSLHSQLNNSNSHFLLSFFYFFFFAAHIFLCFLHSFSFFSSFFSNFAWLLIFFY